MSIQRVASPLLVLDEVKTRLELWTGAAVRLGLESQTRAASSVDEAKTLLAGDECRRGSPLLLITLEPPQAAVYGLLEWIQAERLRRRSLIVALVPPGATAHVSRLYDLGVHSCLTAPRDAEEAFGLLSSIRQYWDVLNVPPVRTA